MLETTLKYFKEIAEIPRCSFKEERIRKYFITWAKEKKYDYNLDNVGNIVIYIPSTKGREDEDIIILQGHMDMVCVKGDDSNHDFDNDPIKIIEENGWLKADNTTLGADNGIGLAISMSASELESHPSLELLITTTEETGMFGALGLDPSNLKGRVLLNLDTEGEEEICISSAGGCRLNIKGDYIGKKSSLNFYKITFGGMKGGHSGIDINKNRGNALFDIVYFLKNYNGEYQLAELNGGVADNAIPYLVDVIVGVSDIQDFVDELGIFVEDTKNIYDAPDLYCNIKKYNFDGLIVDNKIIDSLFDVILDNKVGIFSMSENTTGLVKTSSNLGLMSIKENKIDISYLFRSSEKREQDNIGEIIISNFKGIGFKTEIESIYYGWEENKDNEFIKKVKKAYDETNHKDNKLISYHAGLECGIIIDKLNNDVQAVSIGPNIYDAHSSKERCEVRSIGVICDVVKRILS